MRIVTETTLTRSAGCGVCWDDLPGHCTCREMDVELEVTGDVDHESEGADIRILSVLNVTLGVEEDVKFLDSSERKTFEEKLWDAYVEQTSPIYAVRVELSRVKRLLETSVELALHMGVDPKAVLGTLKQVRFLSMGVKNRAGRAA